MKLYIPGLVLGFAILFFPSQAQACSCAAQLPFLQTAKYSDLVVRGKIIDYVRAGKPENLYPIAIVVDIQERYKGTPKSKRVTIQGNTGIECHPYASEFPIGTEWVVGAYKAPDKKGGWMIGTCGEYRLQVEGETVTGQIRDRNSQSMRLSEFRKLLKNSR
ncbi:MAG: hypothetical protein MUC48_09090 [Leptolyngbya sp. Prado105]|jgi:hypothetical protein|nr:hypothetical protein [Leptolyngbya sp. Prado105]